MSVQHNRLFNLLIPETDFLFWAPLVDPVAAADSKARTSPRLPRRHKFGPRLTLRKLLWSLVNHVPLNHPVFIFDHFTTMY